MADLKKTLCVKFSNSLSLKTKQTNKQNTKNDSNVQHTQEI